MDKSFYVEFINNARNNQRTQNVMAMELCRELLSKVENKRVKFCENNESIEDVPWTYFVHSKFNDDVVTAYVTQIWLDETNHIYADLYLYYQQETAENIYLENFNEIDWLEILSMLY